MVKNGDYHGGYIIPSHVDECFIATGNFKDEQESDSTLPCIKFFISTNYSCILFFLFKQDSVHAFLENTTY